MINLNINTVLSLYFVFDFLYPSQQFFNHIETGLSGLNQYYAEDKVSYSRTQCSAYGKARTCNPLISILALYHCATVLPSPFIMLCLGFIGMECVISESCYIGTILQRNYRKMTKKRPLKKRQKVLMTNGSVMKVERIAECSKGNILQYF